MALIRVEVSAYDITKGVPFYNLSTGPNPIDLGGGNSSWRMLRSSTTQAMTSQVVSSANLFAATGVLPRRAGNTYAVTTVTGTNPGGLQGVFHCPATDFIRNQPNETFVMSKWVYIKTSGSPTPGMGMGVGYYDKNFENLGGAGDSSGPPIPLNQWHRASDTFVGSSSSQVVFFDCALTTTATDFQPGDIIVSTDWMVNSGGALVDYFDGSFPPEDGGNTVYSWTDIPWASSSTKVTSVPSSVLLFPPDNIKGYTVTEDSMPLDPASFQGGYGTITFSIDESDDARLLRGKTFELSDTNKGKVSGIVTAMNATPDGVNVTTDSMLGVLNSWQTLEPYEGNLSGYVAYLFNKVSLDLPVRFEDTVADIEFVARGYVGNMWDWIKQLLSVIGVEMALVYNTVVFRPLRTYEAYMGRSSDASWDISSSETAKAIEVTYYQNTYAYQEFYPITYDRDSDQAPVIMQVDANETVEYVLQLSATPEPDFAPDIYPVYTIGNEPQTVSVYSVSGSDDLPIQPVQWAASGGKLTVKVSETDPTQVIVTLTGANIPSLAPFRIAMSSGGGNYYNSLHLAGWATKFEPKVVRIPTGASQNITGTDVGITVTNPFVSTKEQAFNAGMRTAAAYTGFNYTVSGAAWDINRAGFTGGVYPTIANFNAGWPLGTETIEDFNTKYGGTLIAQFNSQWDESIQDTYAVQAFGNAAGARVRSGDAYFRIDSATFNEVDVSYTASLDTMVSDFNSVWSGATIDQFNDEHYQKFVRDFSVVPLRRTDD